MEILTQMLVLLAVGRAMGLGFGGVRASRGDAAGQSWIAGAGRWGLWMMMAAGLAGNLDGLSAWAGAAAYFRCEGALTHSLVSSLVIAGAVGGAFWWRGQKDEKQPVKLSAAIGVCLAGVAARTVLDLAGSEGVRLLWPFSEGVFAWDWIAPVDPWIVVGVAVALLWPVLISLITEEIGAKKKKSVVDKGAVAALVLLVVYFGARAMVHGQVVTELDAVVYRGAIPKKVGAFPKASSPFVWRGMAETANTFEEVEVHVLVQPAFDPDQSRTMFKPEGSPALEAAGKSGLVQRYMQRARFGKAWVEKIDAGWRVTLRDLRAEGGQNARRGVMVVLIVNGAGNVVEEELRFEEG